MLVELKGNMRDALGICQEYIRIILVVLYN